MSKRVLVAIGMLVLALACASCAAGTRADEPQDLVAANRTIASLRTDGWEIQAPVEDDASSLPAKDAPSSLDGQAWSTFMATRAPGDELRPVRNNAGVGYALFREGKFVSLYLTTIF